MDKPNILLVASLALLAIVVLAGCASIDPARQARNDAYNECRKTHDPAEC